MDPRLPSRYEDLDAAFRARLKPVPVLIDKVKAAFQSMKVSGGIRFLPLFGKSGSGKTCAARELSTHLPDCHVQALERAAIESGSELNGVVKRTADLVPESKMLVFVVDQFEEAVTDPAHVASGFIERLSLLDRGELRHRPAVFVWLTTSRDFQSALAGATSRNRRILVAPDFELKGPSKAEWPGIIEETFSFHNSDAPLADFDILLKDLEDISRERETIGEALERVGERIAGKTPGLQDISIYHVVMLWPVTDGLRITRIQQFTDPRQGYKLNWDAWFRQLNEEDRRQLPLEAYNRARLYFDVRLVPIAAADLHHLCRDLDDPNAALHKTYLERFQKTHLYSIVAGSWNPQTYAPLRERDSDRAIEARQWYETVTSEQGLLCRRLARVFEACGIKAEPQAEVKTIHARVVADVCAERTSSRQSKVCIELKAFSADNTMPSTIKDQVRMTLKKYAQVAGFLHRQ